MITKLGKRKCKVCKEAFQKTMPLQVVCPPPKDCAIIYGRKLKEKAWKKEKREKKPFVYFKENKKNLQIEINKLARKIDAKFNYGCIDCGKPITKQGHGAHYHNVGGNENIRYNLHNIHSSTSQCNFYSSEHKKGYEEGLKQRYGDEYFTLVDKELGKLYPRLGLREVDVAEKLKVVRKINRTFDTYKLENGRQARELFNKIIGIYK